MIPGFAHFPKNPVKACVLGDLFAPFIIYLKFPYLFFFWVDFLCDNKKAITLHLHAFSIHHQIWQSFKLQKKPKIKGWGFLWLPWKPAVTIAAVIVLYQHNGPS